MGNRLSGKSAVVTGASSGIGLAAARRFASEGAKVFLMARDPVRLEAAVASVGHGAIGVAGDVSNQEDLRRLYETVAKERGSVDIVFANAGAAIAGNLGEITSEQFDAVVGVNMRGTLFTVQQALPLFVDGGSIILMGSIAGVKGRAGRSVYAASKAALRSFARSWASDLKDRGIRVNVLSGGPTDTGSFAGASESARAHMAAMTVRGSLGQPDEIANAALFLASDEASFVNGSEVFADGGAAQV